MNNLCADIGFKSINHEGEQLCGDHIDIIENEDGSTIIVLADGLGSGVKASILSTLTSKIISTMISEGLSLESCVDTIAKTLPICSVRGVAYSTFSIIYIKKNEEVELIQYDNPQIVFIRDGEVFDYPKIELVIDGKKIYKTQISIREGDVITVMSDGCPHAGIGNSYNFGWDIKDIADYIKVANIGGYTAKTISTMLIDECYKLYGGQPGDDATACVVKIRKREPVNILFGPPSDRNDCNRMMALFFAKEGKHIVCGGTTSSIAADYLGKEVITSLDFLDPEIPPISEIEGVDLVTEGVITINRVVKYAKDYVSENKYYDDWCFKRDGAALISRMLFEEATDINFFVGRAINPAHQNPDLPINFNIKMNLVEELTKYLKQMGKRIKVSYF
ncbi:MAG: serine/threonine-protein phosphatase [Coprobacillus sp.]|nr:serine/threonine-protein phosphatase [Coprobacillus sp.]MDY4145299.1 SpoIIE family protein phosphatase [Bacilli bacterium]